MESFSFALSMKVSQCVVFGCSKSSMLRVVRLTWQPCFHGNGSCIGAFSSFIGSCQFRAGGREEAWGFGEEGKGRREVHTTDGVFYSCRITPSFSLFASSWMTQTTQNKEKQQTLCMWENKQWVWWCYHFFSKKSHTNVWILVKEWFIRSPWIKSVCVCICAMNSELVNTWPLSSEWFRRKWPFHDEMTTGTWWNLKRASGLCVFIDLSTWTPSPITVSSGQLNLPGNKHDIRVRDTGMLSL